jgi:hypothetical protein
MHDHEGERRLPGYILTAKFLQRVVPRRRACIQLGITVIVEGRTLTLSVALATDGPLTEHQRSSMANKRICYLLGGRSSGSDAHTGSVRSLRLPSVVGFKHKPALPTDNNAFHA